MNVDEIKPFDTKVHLDVIFESYEGKVSEASMWASERKPWCLYAMLSSPQFTESRRHHVTANLFISRVLFELSKLK